MASKWPPVKNSGFTFRVYLFAQSDNQIKTSPTLAAGDFQVSTDGAAFANLGTLPSESPASSGQVLVTLSAAEMNGDEVTVKAIDASGAEWHSAAWVIHTVGQTLDTVDGNVDSILTDTAEIGAAGAGLTAVPWNASWDAEVQSEVTDGLNAYDPPTKAELDSAVSPLATSAALATVDTNVDAILVDTGTTIPATLAGLATAAALGTVDGIVDAILVDTDTTIPALIAALNDPALADIVGGVWDAPTAAHVGAGSMGAAVGDTATNAAAILVDTDATIPGLIAALNNLSAAQVNAEVVDVLRTDTIPDSYPADGAQPTIAQALLVIQQFLTEKEAVGTTLTVKKPDGSTTAMTFTLDDADAPTSITRAT